MRKDTSAMRNALILIVTIIGLIIVTALIARYIV